MENILATTNTSMVVSNTVDTNTQGLEVNTNTQSLKVNTSAQGLKVNTKPSKFNAIKIYRSHHTITGSFKSLNDFAHNAYKQRLFRTLPGTTYIVFEDEQKWFPDVLAVKADYGSKLYANIAKRNNLFNALGVRFYFTTRSDTKQMIEMQVVNSDTTDTTDLTDATNKCTPVRGKRSSSSDSKWDKLVATPRAPRNLNYKKKAPSKLDLSSIAQKLEF